MYYLGIDIGSSATKAVVLDEKGGIQATAAAPLGAGTAGVERVLSALREQGIEEGSLGGIVATGYGRKRFAQAQGQISEISCHAKGARFLCPGAGTVIDVGGQDSKVIQLDKTGLVQQFVMNDKCAAGTGRFLDMMAHVTGLTLEDMSQLSRQAEEVVPISSTCAVFAESEVISQLAEGKALADVLAGVNASVARRVAGLALRLGVKPQVVMTGGVADNLGVVAALEQELGCEILIPDHPQLVGALGAALFALERNGKP